MFASEYATGASSSRKVLSSKTIRVRFYVYSVCKSTGHGTYLLRYDGVSFSHSSATENFKQRCDWLFKEESIIVELDPLSGKLTISKYGQSSVTMETSIRRNSTDAVHFFALLGNSSGSISLV